ncbi:MAG: thioredoxin-like domain-containing protein [Bacteroidota bacterium]
MMKKILAACSLLLALTLVGAPQAQATILTDWDITFKVKGLQAGDTCLIAYYLADKQYIKDTLFANAGGTIRYQGQKGDTIDPGIFMFVTPGMKYFEFIFVEPKFSLETEVDDMVNQMKIKGSLENTLFFDYLRFMEVKQKEAEPLREDAETNKDQLQKIDQEVMDFKNKFIDDNAEAFIAKVFRASRDPEIPTEGPLGEDGKVSKTYQYQYYKQHYLDGLDFSDDRLLRTPVFQQRIKDYLNRITVQHPDSIIESVSEIVERARANQDVFRFCVITAMNLYAGTKKMCFDKIYVHIAGSYYVSGDAYWVDSTQMSKIKDRYYKMMYNTCDRRAVNLIMKDPSNRVQQLYDINADYTVVVFWAYDCGHCKKEIPQLGEFYKEYKEKGVEVFAVSTKEDLEKWKEFLKDKEVEDWINVADPEHKTNFRVFYDVYSTPVVYLLDKDKRIIGKRLDVENLRKFINHELGIEEPEPEGGELKGE